jgi:hypothetical protein
MNNPITVRIKSDIGITDEQKNELREKLVYVFIEQLRKSGMYKVTEGKNGNVWILRADLILPKKYEAEPDNGWISVDDRLPEPETWVMVYIKYLSPVFEIERGIYKTDNIKKVFFDDKSFYCGSGTVTHWRHLPKPPKGE